MRITMDQEERVQGEILLVLPDLLFGGRRTRSWEWVMVVDSLVKTTVTSYRDSFSLRPDMVTTTKGGGR